MLPHQFLIHCEISFLLPLKNFQYYIFFLRPFLHFDPGPDLHFVVDMIHGSICGYELHMIPRVFPHIDHPIMKYQVLPFNAR